MSWGVVPRDGKVTVEKRDTGLMFKAKEMSEIEETGQKEMRESGGEGINTPREGSQAEEM